LTNWLSVTRSLSASAEKPWTCQLARSKASTVGPFQRGNPKWSLAFSGQVNFLHGGVFLVFFIVVMVGFDYFVKWAETLDAN
jgi:hypothetical protein